MTLDPIIFIRVWAYIYALVACHGARVEFTQAWQLSFLNGLCKLCMTRLLRRVLKLFTALENIEDERLRGFLRRATTSRLS